MKGDDNPSVTRAKMIALLSLIDVLSDRADMSAVAIDRVGTNGGGRFAGKLRLKFSVFGQEARLMQLADELTANESPEALMGLLQSSTAIPDKIAFAMDRIGAWSEVVRRLLRLLQQARLPSGDAPAPAAALPEGQRALPPTPRRCHPGDRCSEWPDCESCGPARL